MQAESVWSQLCGAVLGWLALDTLIACLGFELSVLTLAVEMLLPLTLAGISLRAGTQGRQWAVAAEIVAASLLVVSVGCAFGLIELSGYGPPHLWPAIFFAEAAICLGLSSRVSSRLTPAVLAAISVSAATWQVLLLLGVTHYVFMLAIACFGLACLVASSCTRSASDALARFALVSQWTGRLCISYGSVATVLIALSRLLTSEAAWPLVGMLVVQMGTAAIAGLLTKQSGWRRHFWIFAVVQFLLTLLVVNSLSTLNFFQRGELLLTTAGLIVLAMGYWGWSREADRQEELVSFNLALGSFFSAVPLTLGMLVQRFDNQLAEWSWGLVHEAGVLVIGLLLLGAGVLCRIRWSTIIGGSTLMIYVVSLFGLVRLPEQLQTTAIYMMIGGGLFFSTAVLLSIYRDRLLAIPKRVQEREGVFHVLKWR